jgi:glycosyltransferase involved in cell wall biosynthesis
LVVSGENGYLFTDEHEAAALLRTMLEDTEKTGTMGKKSREIVASQYSLEEMGQGYRKIYTSMTQTATHSQGAL